MAKYLIDDASLITIADAIRSKTGETATLSLAEMASRIDQLGGGDTAIVDSIIDGSITEINNNAISVRPYAFYGCTSLTTANLPNITTLSSACFWGCTSLTTVNCPKITRIGTLSSSFNGAFQGCTSLTAVNFPNVTNLGYRSFYECTSLTTVNLPNLVSIESSHSFYKCASLTEVNFPNVPALGSYTFHGCSKLKVADFTALKNIGNNAFENCIGLTTLIIRGSDVCKIGGSAAFRGANAIAGKTGYIYVPSALVESYKTATYWSTHASQFRALEDYTIDGTTTGALDKTKI